MYMYMKVKVMVTVLSWTAGRQYNEERGRLIHVISGCMMSWLAKLTIGGITHNMYVYIKR